MEAMEGGVTYAGEESLLIPKSPVVDTALKFRGQLDFGLVVGFHRFFLVSNVGSTQCLVFIVILSTGRSEDKR